MLSVLGSVTVAGTELSSSRSSKCCEETDKSVFRRQVGSYSRDTLIFSQGPKIEPLASFVSFLLADTY